MLLATNRTDRWLFVFGFEKAQLGNISTNELKALQMLGTDLLKLSAKQLTEHLRRTL